MNYSLQVKRLSTAQADFSSQLEQRLAWESVSDAGVQEVVEEIISAIREQGDAALLSYTNKFDGLNISSPSDLEINKSELKAALDSLPPAQRKALEAAAKRIHDFHLLQKPQDIETTDALGNKLGQRVTAVDRAGVYVPGGKASYPSSVLMNIIPAKVAGVKEIIMVVPTPQGIRNPMVLAAASLAGADKVLTIGGAQAIAALAYGTQTVPRVDKIVGPGNVYVATAKRAVFGQVGIDMIAGPSEILVICDGKTPADWIAADLFSQAEHDEQAQAILISDDENYLNEVEKACQDLLQSMPRAQVIAESFAQRSCFILVKDMGEAVQISNQIAPEHLELSLDNPEQYIDSIRHAGAIFMGRYTPEAFGDYCAGPNHVLPTSGTARFSSPLGVHDFIKRSSIIYCTQQGAGGLADIAATLADAEGLPAHALSARKRGH